MTHSVHTKFNLVQSKPVVSIAERLICPRQYESHRHKLQDFSVTEEISTKLNFEPKYADRCNTNPTRFWEMEML